VDEDTQQPTGKPDNENQIPYHSAYFGCCNRTVMTREDIAQPRFCCFCGKELKKEPEYILQLETLLYDAIVELEYVQSVENCNSGLCATAKGKNIVDLGMATLGIDDLESETWNEAKARAEET
jgi:hypothetical protein